MVRILILLLTFWLTAPVTAKQSPPQGGYRIQPFDAITILLPAETGFNKEFNVDRQGRITLPEVGFVPVAGLNDKELQQAIHKALSPLYRDLSTLQVALSKKQILVDVQGYVNKPGEIVVASDTSMQSLLSTAGGVRKGAQLDQFQLRRGKKMTIFNYKKFLDTGDENVLPRLQSFDTIFVPASAMTGNVERNFDLVGVPDSEREKEDVNAVKVFGEVIKPGSFPADEGATLVDFIMRAGGVTRYAAVEAIRVISNEVPTIFNLTKYLDSGDASLLPKITKGATIYVPKQEEDNKSTMSNTVHVMGEVEKQGSILAPEPVSLIELLADAGGTSRFADLSNTRIIKADGRTFVYDLAAYSEGKNGEPVPQVVAGDFVFVPEKSQELKPENTVRILGEVAKPGQIMLGDNMSLIDVIAYAGGPTFRADITKIEVTTPAANGKVQKYDFNLEAFMKEGLPEAKLPAIGAGSTVWLRTLPDDPVGNKSKWIQQGSDVSVYLFGQIGSPGRYRFNENMSILDLLAAADGPTGSADLRNIRITQFDGKQPKVTRFNMALFFETGDPALLPKIKIGDSVYVPDRNGNWLDKPKEQTVRVIGAVNQPGRYSFSDDMTILDLLAEAGGPSSAAYINKITVINYSNQRDQARTFDLAKFSRTANFDELPVLRAGDTIYIPSRDESLPQIIRQFMTDIFQMAGIAALVGLI